MFTFLNNFFNFQYGTQNHLVLKSFIKLDSKYEYDEVELF